MAPRNSSHCSCGVLLAFHTKYIALCRWSLSGRIFSSGRYGLSRISGFQSAQPNMSFGTDGELISVLPIRPAGPGNGDQAICERHSRAPIILSGVRFKTRIHRSTSWVLYSAAFWRFIGFCIAQSAL